MTAPRFASPPDHPVPPATATSWRSPRGGRSSPPAIVVEVEATAAPA